MTGAVKTAVAGASSRCVAGALFDFLGYLTTRESPVTFSTRHSASPAVEVLQAWADKKGLDISDADVENWDRGFRDGVDQNGVEKTAASPGVLLAAAALMRW